MKSVLNFAVTRRLGHVVTLHVPAILIVLILSFSAVHARAEGGWKLIAANRTVAGEPALWVKTQKPNSPGPLLVNLQLQRVSCPSARTCFAVGTHFTPNGPNVALVILASRDGGTSWSMIHTQPGLASGPLSCPGPRQCYAIVTSFSRPTQSSQVSLLHTTDGGKSWRRGTIDVGPGSGFFLNALACPTATVCYIAAMTSSPVGASGTAQAQAVLMATRDGGKHWKRIPLSGVKNLYLRAIACTSVTSCNVGGVTRQKSCSLAGAILHTGDGGSTWVRHFDDCATGIGPLACPTVDTCYAGGWYGSQNDVGNQLVLRTNDGGASWEDQLEGPIDRPGNSTFIPISDIACPNAQVCFLSVNNHVVTTTDGGATWTIRTPVGNAILNAISCPTTRVCVSVGVAQPSFSGFGPPQTQMTGLILRTVDGGKTWMKS